MRDLIYTVPLHANPERSQNVAVPSMVSGTGTSRSGGQPEQFSAEELAIVLSHFDIGIIDSIIEFPRGSRKAPKLLIVSEQGKFLLKRRPAARTIRSRSPSCHALQLYLAGKQFPLPHLIGTKKDNNSMLQWRNGVYELFEYIPGQRYPQTLESTFDGGRVLALYHKLLQDFKSEWQPPSGSYHMATGGRAGLSTIPPSCRQTDEHRRRARRCSLPARKLPQSPRETSSSMGIDNWPKQIVHADWHPGNMLFRDNHVVAVIDYDAARLLPRIIDIANGALQFSIIGGDDDVSKWPDYLDEARFKRFLRGYDEVMLLSPGGDPHRSPG